ncbi:MAG: DUF11 domain-containing protein, partial [Phycisphaeraceae bacterium]
MVDSGGRTLLSPKWLLVPLLAAAVVALLLAWPSSGEERVQAASGGPEMKLAVTSGSVACPDGKPASHKCVTGGNTFTLTVQVVTAPANGYIQFNSFVDFGTDITYVLPKPTAATEIIWPDLSTSTALRGQPAPGQVNHGGLSGLLPPVATSTFVGNVISLVLQCSTDSTTTAIQLLPEGDPVAGPFGALFVEPDGVTQVTPKVSGVTVNCLGPTPTPTNTLPPNSPTPTISPTPTDTPTPTPLPSERPDVRVTKIDLADPVDSGANFTYRITVTSTGLETAEGVKVVDELPPGTAFVSATSAGANCSHESGVVTCQIKEDMEPSDEVIIDIVVTAPSPEDDDRISNMVSITSTNEPFANTGNNKDKEETVVLAPRSDVTVEKSGEPTFLEGGQDVTYTIV